MTTQRIRQGFSWWCFANRGVEHGALLAGAAKIGYEAVDLIEEALWPTARDHGLRIAAVNGHGTLSDGLNRRENAARIEKELLANIEKAARWEIPVLICFSGNRGDLDDETGLAQCAETLGRVAPRAADAGVTLALELLNSKIDHPGYQGDRTAWGVRLCDRVQSPAVRLLYDIYHMQIMEGDVIRTIRQTHPYFAHYHTAGNPGRGPLDLTQELCYPAIFRTIAQTGFGGFVSHEFLPPAGADPLRALAEAFETGCLSGH
jgi:hydroxypyruvate isomerase